MFIRYATVHIGETMHLETTEATGGSVGVSSQNAETSNAACNKKDLEARWLG